MRHRKANNKIGLKTSHRLSLLKNMTTALFLHGHVTTTLAKAKALRVFAEPIVTRARYWHKLNPLHAMRLVSSILHSQGVVKHLFEVVLGKVGERPGGYLRVVKLGFRSGDGSDIAKLEFVDQ